VPLDVILNTFVGKLHPLPLKLRLTGQITVLITEWRLLTVVVPPMRLEAPQMRKKTTKRETQKNLSLNRKSKKMKARKQEVAQVLEVLILKKRLYPWWIIFTM
jgi:hypothetical protein